MDVTSVLPVWARAWLQTVANVPWATITTLTSVTLHLATAMPSPLGPDWQPGDFTEAAFTGYLPITLGAPGGIINLQNQEGIAALCNGTFVCTTAPASPGVQILGYWIDYVVGTAQPLLAEIFQTPITIVNAGDYVNLAVYLPYLFRNPTP